MGTITRRGFTLAAGGLLAGTALPKSGLLAGIARAEDRITVVWWFEEAEPEDRRNLEELLVKPFMEAHPNIDVRIDYKGGDIGKQLNLAATSGNLPDVVHTQGPSYASRFANAGQLLALDDYAEKFGWNKSIIPLFLEMGKVKGHLYVMPKAYEAVTLLYNKTLFDKHGWSAPVTIAEFEALSDEMLAAGVTPLGMGTAGQSINQIVVSAVLNNIAGPDHVYKVLTGETPWTSDPFVKAIEAARRWWKAGYFGDYLSLSAEEAFAGMAAGRAGMAIVTTGDYRRIPRYFPLNNAEAAVVPVPTGEDIEAPVYALGVGSTLSISANTEHPDAVAELINFIFSDKTFYERMNTAWLGEWSIPLVDTSNLKLGEAVVPVYLETLAKISEATVKGNYGYTTYTFMPPATVTYIIGGLEEVWFDRKTPLEYLQKLDEIFQQERSEGLAPEIPLRT